MRNIKRIFVHCTATAPSATTDSITAAFKRRGWKNPGYHYLVAADGTVTQLLDESGVANGVKGYNQTAIHVAYTGGIDTNGNAADTRTPQQRQTLATLLADIHSRYPHALILGHRDISPDTNHNGTVDPQERIKECPCFDAISDYADI